MFVHLTMYRDTSSKWHLQSLLLLPQLYILYSLCIGVTLSSVCLCILEFLFIFFFILNHYLNFSSHARSYLSSYTGVHDVDKLLVLLHVHSPVNQCTSLIILIIHIAMYDHDLLCLGYTCHFGKHLFDHFWLDFHLILCILYIII